MKDLGVEVSFQVGDMFMYRSLSDSVYDDEWYLVTTVVTGGFSVFRNHDKGKVKAKKRELGI